MSRGVIAGIAILVSAGSAGSAWAQPVFTFELNAVVIDGVTPLGRVSVFSVGRERRSFLSYVKRVDDILVDIDGDGSVRLELGSPVVVSSVWFAVDLEDGEFGIGNPASGSFNGNGLVQPQDDRIAGFIFHYFLDFLEISLVRPGDDKTGGAWGLSVGDGSQRDEDSLQNQYIRVELVDLLPIGDSPAAPTTWGSNDVLIKVDPQTLDYWVWPITFE